MLFFPMKNLPFISCAIWEIYQVVSFVAYYDRAHQKQIAFLTQHLNFVADALVLLKVLFLSKTEEKAHLSRIEQLLHHYKSFDCLKMYEHCAKERYVLLESILYTAIIIGVKIRWEWKDVSKFEAYAQSKTDISFCWR